MFKLSVDCGNFHLCESSAEADFLVKPFAAFEFERNTFFPASLRVENFGFHRSSFHKGSADGCSVVIVDEKNLVKGRFRVVFHSVEAINAQHVTHLYAVLFVTGFENCVCHNVTNSD